MDISGLYLCEDCKSGFLIESAGSGYRVTAVSIREGRIVEKHFSYSIENSSNNCYRLYTEPEKLNYYDVKAIPSGFNGAPYVRVVVASRAVPRGFPLGKKSGRHRSSDNE